MKCKLYTNACCVRRISGRSNSGLMRSMIELTGWLETGARRITIFLLTAEYIKWNMEGRML